MDLDSGVDQLGTVDASPPLVEGAELNVVENAPKCIDNSSVCGRVYPENRSSDDDDGCIAGGVDHSNIFLDASIQAGREKTSFNEDSGKTRSSTKRYPNMNNGGSLAAESSSTKSSKYQRETDEESSLRDSPLAPGRSLHGDNSSRRVSEADSIFEDAPLSPMNRVDAIPPKSSSVSSASSGETDQERNSEYTEERLHTREVGSAQGGVHGAGSDDLPIQLNRLWRAAPPDHSESLSVMRNMLGHRQDLDVILSRLVQAKGTGPADVRAENVTSDSRPFTLATLMERFAPVVADPTEVRERSGARVRIVTAAGLRVGLAKRVFARAPMLPSDVETEEEEQSRRPGASSAPINVENLRALVVPVASASAAPETSPEEPVRYPSMREVSSVMWCDEDDDEDGLNEAIQGRRGHAATNNAHRLRFSIQTLGGQVLDDEDEDSQTDDSDSETNGEDITDDDSDGSFILADSRVRYHSDSLGEVGVLGSQQAGRGGRGELGGEALSELSYRRNEELASVLRRLRLAIRQMDGVLTEEEVRSMAKRVVRVATLTASTSEAVTTAAARGAMRGLGDRTRLERQHSQGRYGVSARWVTVYIGVRRWETHYFGPGFAVETQDKYRLGWLRLSLVTGMPGGPQERRPAGRSWVRRGVFGLGRRAGASRQEEKDDIDVEGWVGSLTCNYCEGHALDGKGTLRAVNSKINNNGPDVATPAPLLAAPEAAFKREKISREEQDEEQQGDEDEIFSQARDSEGTSYTAAIVDEHEPHRLSAPLQVLGAAVVSGVIPPETHSPTTIPSSLDGGAEGGGGERDEWCAGHVCLRLRPDGLREGEPSEWDEHGDTETSGEDPRHSDSGSDEGQEQNDHVRGTGTSDAKCDRTSRSRSLGRGARRKGVPLSSITKGFGAGRKNSADPCGVSSEQSSKSLEAFAWGDNGSGCLGLPVESSAVLLPKLLEPYGLLPAERVVAVSCSERHSMLVTSLGSVFSAGDGTDGALGLGGRESSDAFRLVEWFAEQMPPPKIRLSSAGSDLIGCHSAALDVDGRLYTWGVGAAAGHLSIKPVLLPREVETLGDARAGAGARDADGRPTGLHSRVKGVACGGGFTLAVTNGGKVFAWGSWARGRLGLGQPPTRTSGGKKRVPRFQSAPRRISGFGGSPIKQVAAGEWHGMALTEDGEVYTWGHNASGQLGFLVTPSSISQRSRPMKSFAQAATIQSSTATTASLADMLRSSWTPVKLPDFGSSSTPSMESVKAPVDGAESGAFTTLGSGRNSDEISKAQPRRVVHISCGTEHSIAIDSRGAAWTWGAEGRACLGHGEAGYGAQGEGAAVAAEAQAQAMGRAAGRSKDAHQSFIPLSREREVSRARARRALAGTWAVPRQVTSLAPPVSPPAALNPQKNQGNEGEFGAEGKGGVGIVAAAAGSSHTVLVTAEGRMYIFGEGAAVCGGDVSVLEMGLGGVGMGLTEGEGRVHRSKEEGGIDPLVALSALAGPAPVPREACVSWFPAVAARRVAAVACGGQHVVALLAGDHVGYTLGMDLFRLAVGTDRHAFGGGLNASPVNATDNTTSKYHEAGARSTREEGDEGERGRAKGGVDCELLVGGSYLHAHRVVLARRSPVLRDMIAQEERPGDDGEGSAPLQLLLPDLRFDVARALLEFLYTGELRRPLDLDSPLPYDLRSAAKSYGVTRLEALCTEAISLGADPGVGDGWDQVVPPPTLAGDLGGALGSMEHADTKFIAGGRPIYAHRAVLSCQSEYFAAMFRFRDQMAGGTSSDSGGGDDVAEIVVPDSYPGFVRLLLFLYTGVLPESSPLSVLGDLVAADRYRLLDMKRICQSMSRLSVGNCLQALQVTQMVGAPLLRESALFFAEHNLSDISQQQDFHNTVSGVPGLAEVLFDRLHATAANANATSSAAAREKRLRSRNKAENTGGNSESNADDDLTFRPDSPFPWGAAGVVIACGAIYYKLSNVLAVGMVVPIVNGLFSVGLAVFAINKLKAKNGLGSGRRRGQQSGGGVSMNRGATRKRKTRGGGGGGDKSTYLFG